MSSPNSGKPLKGLEREETMMVSQATIPGMEVAMLDKIIFGGGYSMSMLKERSWKKVCVCVCVSRESSSE